jgi:hypothetical protein
MGDTDRDGDFDELYCFGGHSFSIWNADGSLGTFPGPPTLLMPEILAPLESVCFIWEGMYFNGMLETIRGLFGVPELKGRS